ncbi:MAG: glycosyltransferase [Roseateles sp.]
MRVLLATLGSRGDVEPFLSLALALQHAGHEPVLCASRRFETWITGWGVAYEPMDDGFVALLESLEGRAGLERAASPLGMARTVWRLAPQVKPLQLQVQRDLWRAAQACRPEGLVFHVKLTGAPDIADALGIPAALLLLAPVLQPTAAFACPVFPAWLRARGGPRARRAGYRLVNMLSRRIGTGPALAWRREMGMGPRPPRLDLLHDAAGRPWPVLHAHSASLLPRPADWPAHAEVTGFLRLPASTAWHPSPALQAFLDAGPPPVYIGFGSMAGRDPQARAAQALAALAQAGLRGVIGRGWGGLQPDQLPPQVFALDEAPHDALFPHMAAVVHHGGAGTTAAGLLAGRPSLICPFFGDQPFWGALVHQQGLGPAPLSQRDFSAEALAGRLRPLVGDPAMGRACQAMAARLQQENGGRQAVRALERQWAGGGFNRARPPA